MNKNLLVVYKELHLFLILCLILSICLPSVALAEEESISVIGVTLNQLKLDMEKDEEPIVLTATVEPEDATDKTLIWSTSHEGVATVSEGIVTPVAPGTAVITVTTTDGGFTATCSVLVNEALPTVTAVTGVWLDQIELILTAGGPTETLAATVEPEDATDKVLIWSTSDEGVATVSEGIVTPVASGVTVIMVTTTDGGFTATCDVVVNEAVLTPMMSPMGVNHDHPIIDTTSDAIMVDYEINEGFPWYYSNAYSEDGYDAYLAGNSFTDEANVSNIAFTVSEPGVFSFDYKVSTRTTGANFALYYNINVPIGDDNHESALNYKERANFRGIVDWTNVEFAIDESELNEDGETTIYLAYYRGTDSVDNENMVAIANVCFTSGEKQVTLNIDGNDYGYVIDADNHSYSESENTLYYTSGDTVTLTAEPDTGARFYGWVDGSNKFLSSNETYTFTISSDIYLRAVFAPEGYYAAQCNGTFYTENDGGLEQALIDAQPGDIIVMLEDQSLSENASIPAGVTLYIPYGPFFDEDGNTDGVTTSGSYYQASRTIATSAKAYRALTIEEGVGLTINGTLNIGSVISYPSQYYQGHTSGWHGKIINDGEIIVSDEGTLDCWGFIVGDGTVTAESGSTVYEPFIVYDFAGGWNTAELYFNDQSPFKQYAMQNIQNELIINYGSTFYGRCNLWATGSYNKVDIEFIGENGMYQLGTGATVTRTYDEAKHISTNTDIGKMTYTFNGGMTLRHLSMPILGVAISTAEVEFPVPYNWNIVLQNGDYQYDGRTKLMPGATLQVDNDANLFVNATLFVLDGLIQSDMSGKFYPTTGTLQNNGFSASGQIIVNGNLTVEEGARFGGIIQAGVESGNSSIDIKTGAIVNCTGVQDGAVGEYDANTSIFDLPARAYIYDSVKEKYTLKRLYPNRTYLSYNAEEWDIDNYTMTYAANTTWPEWDGEGPVVDGNYHNWVTKTVELDEARVGSWYSEGEIYHNVMVANKTIYDDNDSFRTIVNQGQLDDEMYEGGDIVFTVDTTVSDDADYVYRVFYIMGDDNPVEINPNEQGEYTISDVHDEVVIEVVSCKLGDINLDNKISNQDIRLLRNTLVSMDTFEGFQELVADLNRDGRISNMDLQKLRRIVLGL